MSDDKITKLPVKPKADTGHLMLVPPPAGCNHYPASFEVDLDGGRCKCKSCGGEVSPIFVLKMLMQEESRWNRTREAYGDGVGLS